MCFCLSLNYDKLPTSGLMTPIADRTVEDIVPLAHTSTRIIVLDGEMDEWRKLYFNLDYTDWDYDC